MELVEAVNEARKFTRFVKAFEKLEETAETLRGAEQAVTERKAAVAALDAQIEQRKEHLAEAESAARVAHDRVAEARGEAQDLVAKAKAEAAEITEAGRKQAGDLQLVIEARKGEIAAAQRELAGLTNELAAAKAVIEKAAKAQAALADLR